MEDEPPPQGRTDINPPKHNTPAQHQHYGPKGIGLRNQGPAAPSQEALNATVVQSFTALKSPATLGGNIGQAFSLLANSATLPLTITHQSRPTTTTHQSLPPPDHALELPHQQGPTPKEIPTHPNIPIGITRHIPLLQPTHTNSKPHPDPTQLVATTLTYPIIANTTTITDSAYKPINPDSPTEPINPDTHKPEQPLREEAHTETTEPNCEDEGASMDVSTRAKPEVILNST